MAPFLAFLFSAVTFASEKVPDGNTYPEGTVVVRTCTHILLVLGMLANMVVGT